MAVRRRTSVKSPSGEAKLSINNDVEESFILYNKLLLSFPEEPTSNSIQKWMKDIIDDLLVNPHSTLNVCKYFSLFANIKYHEQSIGIEVRRCYLQILESLYNDYVKGESDSTKFRNFTYFFGSSINVMWEPVSNPLSKDLISALLILISKLDIMENFENSLVYSKCVFWLSRCMAHGKVSTVILIAYEEALNRLRELIASGKGSLVSLAALEATINGGKLNETGVKFYSKSLSRMDFLDITDNFTIYVPMKEKNKYNKANLNVVFL